MGKYMRSKCRGGAAGEEVAAVEVTQVVGVRTRSRSAAATTGGGGGVAKVVAPRRKKALTPPAAGEPAAAVGAAGGGADGGGSCYIHLRSRMLFMAPPQQQPAAAEAAGAGQPHAGAAALVAAGLSRCSSTASSAVDVGGLRGSHAACRSDAAADQVVGYHVPDVSASNSGSGPAADRERRETTPSSRAHGGELSDLESDLAGQKTGRPLPAAAATVAAEPIVPPAHEIQEFFAAAEAAQAKRFASKYNFDFVRGVPHDAGGRFEWTPVVSI